VKKLVQMQLGMGIGLLFCGLACAQPLPAAASDRDQVERTRISAERKAAETRFTSEETVCYSKFATHDCLNQARAQRRQTLSDLRRQEISLNDTQRKRRGIEQMKKLENRENPESTKQ